MPASVRKFLVQGTAALRTLAEKDAAAFRKRANFSTEWSMNETVVPHYLTMSEADDPVINQVMQDGELRAAVWWEYARTSEPLRRIAAKHQDILSSPGNGLRDAYLELGRTITCFDQHKKPQTIPVPYPPGVLQWPWPQIWESKAFPRKHWLAMTDQEKGPVLDHLRLTPQREIPLPVMDVWDIYSLGIGHARHEARKQMEDIPSIEEILSSGVAQIELQKKDRRPTPARMATLGAGFEAIMVVVDRTLDTKTNAEKFAAMLNDGQKRDGRGGLKITKDLKDRSARPCRNLDLLRERSTRSD